MLLHYTESNSGQTGDVVYFDDWRISVKAIVENTVVMFNVRNITTYSIRHYNYMQVVRITA